VGVRLYDIGFQPINYDVDLIVDALMRKNYGIDLRGNIRFSLQFIE
jgi:hypothetical protein